MPETIAKLKPAEILKYYSQKPEEYWVSLQRKRSLSLFQDMVKRIPAYGKFLKQNRFSPSAVKQYDDLALVPTTNKKKYFNLFHFSDLFRQNFIQTNSLNLTATSGSTGIPTYFFRKENLAKEYSIVLEMFMGDIPKNEKILVVDCFGMGVWIGGLLTYEAFNELGRRRSLTLIAPGVNKKEIFHSLRNLVSLFDNLVLCGYPPFIKDILDEAEVEGIDLKKINTKLLFAAESFTEKFRDYVRTKSHLKNIMFDTLNIYGTAELGAMAFETPLSIFIRRLALKNPQVYAAMFESGRLPTLVQYNPEFVNFDQDSGQILITADSPTPFFRYKVGDRGGVTTFKKISEIFSEQGMDLVAEAKRSGIPIFKLPFVYVYERADFTVSFYGLQIYPQVIRRALEARDLERDFTGKFVAQVLYDKKTNQYLEINLELKPKTRLSSKLKHKVETLVAESLINESSEYRELSKAIGAKKSKPRLVFWPFNHPKYFKPGAKQQWVSTK